MSSDIPGQAAWSGAADPRDEALLALAAGGDRARLEAMLASCRAGEPAPYVAGFLIFRGRRFCIDRRAYITDPEITHLVDIVAATGVELENQLGRPPCLLEFGVGAGPPAISLQLEHLHWQVGGLDFDRAALELARENARGFGLVMDFFESDYFSGWPGGRTPPDLIFGDPPWGDAGDLYDSSRGADYYRQMPPKSAFPSGGGSRCAIHDELIRRVGLLGWPSQLVLNYGVLPRDLIEKSCAPLLEKRLLSPRPGLTVMVGSNFARRS